MDEEFNLFGGLNEKGESVVKPLAKHYTQDFKKFRE